ncbi:MAG: class I SAM-dependent methyltransferase [Planctomycetota bacterium]|nr:MAG: class I SAM-dependent methyltransferase [Planctomycetota bacterium]
MRQPWFLAAYRASVLRRLEKVQHGGLRIIEGDSIIEMGKPDHALQVRLDIHDPRFWKELALGGGNGAAEAYIMGWWDCNDLVGLVRILCNERQLLTKIEGGLAWLSRPARRIAHLFNRNSRSGAARNISAHYDLGNEFFARMLDESMMYSAAIYPHPQASLAEAQTHKLNRICQQLDLSADDHLLEIGSGWGGMALHAASHFGCRVTTTTISREQYRWCQERVRLAGLQDRIEILLQDYRDLQAPGKGYDKLVSIEMIEAIGYRQYQTFFATCQHLLKPEGLALIQAITIADQEFDRAKHHVDFIKRYIFPGSCIPSLSALQQAMTRASDLRTVDLEDITPHYAQTLKHWRERFHAQHHDISAMGFSEHFMRMWDFYLAYCEGGFAERAIGDIHLLVARPEWRSKAAKGLGYARAA